jgi:hypothetical protein
MLSPPLLAQLAIGGHITLTPADRRRLPKTTLSLLATGGYIELARYERDSLNPHTLAILAVTGLTTLQPNELKRLSADLQSAVQRKTATMVAAQRLRGVKITAAPEMNNGFSFSPAITSVSH